MNTTNIIALTAVTVIAGRWAQNKTFDGKVVVGAIVVIIFLYLMGTFAPEIATPLATLALVAALLGYGPAIFAHLGK